jgi:Cu/Ag efflux protein CusF
MTSMSRGRIVTLIASLTCALFVSVAVHAQTPPAGKKEHAFKGKVEKVDEKTKMITVNNENIPGWMMSMTMTYKVDKGDALKGLKATPTSSRRRPPRNSPTIDCHAQTQKAAQFCAAFSFVTPGALRKTMRRSRRSTQSRRVRRDSLLSGSAALRCTSFLLQFRQARAVRSRPRACRRAEPLAPLARRCV